MENLLKEIEEKIEKKGVSERKRIAKITATIIFILIVVIFITTGAGFGNFKSTSDETKEEEHAKGKSLSEALYEFTSSVVAGIKNLKESFQSVQSNLEQNMSSTSSASFEVFVPENTSTTSSVDTLVPIEPTQTSSTNGQ